MATALSPTPPEIESTLVRLSSHRNVRGVMVLAREGGLVRHTGTIFEGEQGKKYAASVKKIVDCCSEGLEDGRATLSFFLSGALLDSMVLAQDELRFMRIRTKKHEVLITPDKRYILVVLQDPAQ
ncbi:hypothetical protein BOTBODRAFT_103378 [Botryobasidium botryosum FD-172 SS1]|uniref:Roadblock/LAMTOR2 domain-containing protein n=1 Tax=Botryobasidium botryosum (strain FD-172 SS1) TaxID=930990 RepID=A0A067MSR2_BOTB1|nr:hypothetical protein BOTBODRAFT_103378 [Botryobasidium botryosum FD-172 SS1]